MKIVGAVARTSIQKSMRSRSKPDPAIDDARDAALENSHQSLAKYVKTANSAPSLEKCFQRGDGGPSEETKEEGRREQSC